MLGAADNPFYGSAEFAAFLEVVDEQEVKEEQEVKVKEEEVDEEKEEKEEKAYISSAPWRKRVKEEQVDEEPEAKKACAACFGLGMARACVPPSQFAVTTALV